MEEKKLLRVGLLLVVLLVVGNYVRAHDDDDHDDHDQDNNCGGDDGHDHDDDDHYHHDQDDDDDDCDDDVIGFPSDDPPRQSDSASASVIASPSPNETTPSRSPPAKTPSATRTRKASSSRKPSTSRSRTRSKKPSKSRTRTRSRKPSQSRTISPVLAPFHRWSFDEVSGDVAFDVGTARPRHNGLLSQTKRIATSQGGVVMRLLGQDDSFMDISEEVGQFGTKDFSVTFWLQTNDQSRYFELLGNRDAPSHGNFFCMRMTRQGQVAVEVDQDEEGTNYIGINGGSLLNNGKWHHLAAVRKGKTLALYIDGVLSVQGSASGVANIFNDNPFKIGKTLMGFDLHPPKASYDDVRIYNSALAATAIKDLAKRAPEY